MIRIESANYGVDLYDNSIHCVWFFTSPEGSNILFNILDFNTESGYDHVKVGSGTDPRINVVHEFTGSVAPSTHRIASTQAWMEFTSDVSFGGPGFLIQVSYGELMFITFILVIKCNNIHTSTKMR